MKTVTGQKEVEAEENALWDMRPTAASSEKPTSSEAEGSWKESKCAYFPNRWTSLILNFCITAERNKNTRDKHGESCGEFNVHMVVDVGQNLSKGENGFKELIAIQSTVSFHHTRNSSVETY